MLINILVIFISSIFYLLKLIYLRVFPKSNFQTLPGFLLLKLPVDFLYIYLTRFRIPIILVTGTNGKTSTAHLITHLLKPQKFKILSNHTGSNLKRGILSSLVLNYLSNLKTPYDFIVFEVDEGSILEISKSIPFNIPNIYLILLNLSRDQLDRYGEIDTIASKINQAVKLKSIKLITKETLFTQKFDTFIEVTNHRDLGTYTEALELKNSPHLIENLKFVLTLFEVLKIKINPELIKPFILVLGRGSLIFINGINFEVHLSKNPVSFENSLKLLDKSDIENVLIIMNDGIPDGRDVSWFYDINYLDLIHVLKSKNVYVAGTRSYDFFNFLKLLKVNTFNSINFENYLKMATLYNINKTFVLANYSATVSISNLVSK